MINIEEWRKKYETEIEMILLSGTEIHYKDHPIPRMMNKTPAEQAKLLIGLLPYDDRITDMYYTDDRLADFKEGRVSVTTGTNHTVLCHKCWQKHQFLINKDAIYVFEECYKHLHTTITHS